VQAFERAAVDYLLKPLQSVRLRQSLERIKPLAQQNIAQAATNNVASVASDLSHTSLQQLRSLLGVQATAASMPLLVRLQVSVGNSIALVPIEEVLYFEAADKYVRVLTASKEYLIRTPIKDLMPQLDPDVFWQIHRSTVVRASAIREVRRDEAGRLRIALQGGARSANETLPVSRLFAHLFKAM
jgi:DNA-binding LytR/AlgR family response regulator